MQSYSDYPVSPLTRRPLFYVVVFFSLLLLGIAVRSVQVFKARQEPAQAYLVLGGSSTREVFATGLAKAHPERILLISGGSPDPCLRLMFENNGAPMKNVWTEHCSQNTFENFVYSCPILESKNVRRVILVTDYPQVERALPIAEIIFFSRGIAVDYEGAPRPMRDHKPEIEKIGLIIMALGWSFINQLYQPHCAQLVYLPDVDMAMWYQRGFECQQQSGVPSFKPQRR